MLACGRAFLPECAVCVPNDPDIRTSAGRASVPVRSGGRECVCRLFRFVLCGERFIHTNTGEHNEGIMESLIPPFAAYKGDDPYIFVSYAHKNSEVVFAHITRLHEEGFRIWYDEGIDPGTDWSDEIAGALAKAEIFLVFISAAAIASHNVRKEIVFAIDQRKTMLCVHVEEAELPLGLKMQLGNIQALLENRFHEKEKFYERMFSALLPERTRGIPAAKGAKAAPGASAPRRLSPAAPRHGVRNALLGLALLALLGAAAFFLLPRLTGQGLEFADPQLESALRQELARPRGLLAPEDLAGLHGKLSLAGRGITDIGPLAHARGLSLLDLENNRIADIRPLASLHGLLLLGLGHNRIEDLAPLHGLKNSLTGLSLAGNPVKDLTQLRPLRQLEVLDLSGVPITDLELGKYLRKLRTLILDSSGNGLDEESLRRFVTDLPPNCEVKREGGPAQ